MIKALVVSLNSSLDVEGWDRDMQDNRRRWFKLAFLWERTMLLQLCSELTEIIRSLLLTELCDLYINMRRSQDTISSIFTETFGTLPKLSTLTIISLNHYQWCTCPSWIQLCHYDYLIPRSSCSQPFLCKFPVYKSAHIANRLLHTAQRAWMWNSQGDAGWRNVLISLRKK